MNILYYSIIKDEDPTPLFVGGYEECRTEVKKILSSNKGVRYNICKTEIINTYCYTQLGPSKPFDIPPGSVITFPERPSLPC